jgi:putative ABC transport system ATP-binding protein
MDAKPTVSGLNLTRIFGSELIKTIALREASLDLYGGQMALIMGPSGSGKSTLLAALSGLLRPDSGQVVLLGENLWQLSERDRKRFRLRHCGFIFQGYNLFPALTARQQLEMVLRWGIGASRRTARLQAEEMLRLLGLGGKMHLRPSQLSGGEQQRVAIARALAKEPPLILADEPTGNLDEGTGLEVMRVMSDLRRRTGATMVVVTHNPRLTAFADRVLRIERGRIQRSGDTAAAAP